jgi:hypothetical protein
MCHCQYGNFPKLPGSWWLTERRTDSHLGRANSWTSGRLKLIKSTLTAMGVYISICLGLPPWVVRALKKILMAHRQWQRQSKTGAGFKTSLARERFQLWSCMCSCENISSPLSLHRMWRIDLSGVGPRHVLTLFPQLTVWCSTARRRCWEQRSYGR